MKRIFILAMFLLLVVSGKAFATPLSLQYGITDLGGGLYEYDFDLTLEDGSGIGAGFDWFIFGDVASGSSPLADFTATLLPAGWSYFPSSGGHNGPTMAYGVNGLTPMWQPSAINESISWSGTSATLLESGLKWSYLQTTLAPNTRANFANATYLGLESVVPEPASLALMGLGLLGLGFSRRKV